MKFKKYASRGIALALCLITLTGATTINADTINNDNEENIIVYEESTEIDLDEIVEDINMSYSDIYNLHKDFQSKNPKAKLYNDGYDDIEDFVNYAVFNGMIEDTIECRGTLTKAAYRAEFKNAAIKLKDFGLFYAGDFLANSLNDKPQYKSYAASSNLTADIKLQSGYKDSKNTIKTAIGKLPSSKTTYYRENSFNLNKNGSNKKSWDMFLALHGVSYTANATKKSGKWSYAMTVTDYYDFKPENYKDSPIVNTVNNFAVGAQKVGAIVPFNIKVLINDSI